MSDPTDSPAPGRAEAAPRQRIERMPGARRARLTPAPGTIPEPAADALQAGDVGTPTGSTASAAPGSSGPNDERMRRDVPPHY
ncbi:hypothetical protein [Microbacterium sp. SORGH_AS_0888]|uniref:hypothetical protein n=1 Tax=Microbacterium sp. SORGH_AS_0888 TaxID=3041791 RepID=UPI00277FF78D|nr:hypothetical protein [Microbacterium sp. SORGH_AS_0888]MDQ1131191.1 hypothetical protein [Microbacterium sp. SORGH_AS_0888]